MLVLSLLIELSDFKMYLDLMPSSHERFLKKREYMDWRIALR